MSPSTLLLNKVLAIFTVGGDIFIVIFIVAFLLKLLLDDKRLYEKIADFFYKRGLFLAFLIAASTVLGSIYYSDVVGFEPCKLCWLQRIFMFPQAIILAIALYLKDRKIAVYSLALSVMGALIAMDMIILQYLNVSLIPCSSAVAASCNKIYVSEFGYVTIPVMSLTAFLLLIISMWFVRENKLEMPEQNSAQNLFLHEVAITAIVVKDGKYLIVKRSMQKKRFTGMWTIPGGRLEPKDYLDFPKDTKDYWYNVLEQTLKRELHEEVGITVSNVVYVTSLARVHEDGAPSLVISCLADYVSGDIRLQEGETDEFAWVTLTEAKAYDLIDGIYDELVMADNQKQGKKTEWQRGLG